MSGGSGRAILAGRRVFARVAEGGVLPVVLARILPVIQLEA